MGNWGGLRWGSGAWALVALTGCVGCAANGSPECSVGADCASGMCRANGTCIPLDGGGVATDAGPPGDAGPPIDAGALDDAGPGTDSGIAIDAGVVGCVPDRDGTIRRSEIPLMAELRATFRVATEVNVDTSGEVIGVERAWDFSGDLTGDRDVLVDLRDPAGMWFAESFPGATYVTELSVTEDLLGVFELTGDSLLLLGVVSPEDGLTRTELEYDPPIEVLRFPLTEGASWRTESTVSGVALGVITAYSEDYDNRVDAAGTLETPFGSFDVLRVRTTLERTIGFVTTTIRSFAFTSECFGTVATVSSEDDEDQAEFTEAAEIRRLTP